MTEDTQKIPGLKAIKVKPPLHRMIDIESATTGVPMYVLVAQAWDAYEAAKAAGLSTGVGGLSSGIPRFTNRPSPLTDPIVKTVLGQIVELGTTSAKLLEEVRRLEVANGEDLDDPEIVELERIAESEEVGGEHQPSAIPAKPTQGKEGSAHGRRKKAGGK